MSIRYSTMDINADYNIVFGGVNDFRSNHQVPVGTQNDTTLSTFYGSLYVLINGLIERYPTKRIAFKQKPQGLKENIKVAQAGGKIASNTRKDLENVLGESVVTSSNALSYQYIDDKQIKLKN